MWTSIIVNPNLSIRQQLLELKGEMDWAGCHAGRYIFFLGADQKTLRPCYHFSERIVDELDGKPLKPDLGYVKCTDCRHQHFRDPSIAYAAISRPWDFMKEAKKSPPVLAFPEPDVLEQELNALALRRSGFGRSFILEEFSPSIWINFEKKIPRFRSRMQAYFDKGSKVDGRQAALKIVRGFLAEINPYP